MQTIESLRADILARYVSIHAFCKLHPELTRATVYQVLAGKYPGRVDKKVAVIRAALRGQQAEAPHTRPALTQDETAAALQSIRCGNCRKLDKRGCPDCRHQTDREARELFVRLFPGLEVSP